MKGRWIANECYKWLNFFCVLKDLQFVTYNIFDKFIFFILTSLITRFVFFS